MIGRIVYTVTDCRSNCPTMMPPCRQSEAYAHKTCTSISTVFGTSLTQGICLWFEYIDVFAASCK